MSNIYDANAAAIQCVLAALRNNFTLTQQVSDHISTMPFDMGFIGDGQVGVGISIGRSGVVESLNGDTILGRVFLNIVAIQQAKSADGVAPVSKLVFQVLQKMANVSDVQKVTPYGQVTSIIFSEPLFYIYTDDENQDWQHMGGIYEIGVQGVA